VLTNGKTDYLGSFIYENDELKYIQTGGGRIVVEQDTSFKREYYLTDHLGNVRVVFDTNGQVLQEDSYYPFGSTQKGLNYVSTMLKDNDLKNRYLFGSQEQDSKTGFFEYHYRQCDSWLGRWHVQDPLMEFYATQSPYHFAGNNPINNYEVNGADYYMSPFDSKNYGDDDDGFSFDIGDGFGSDGGGGWKGWSGGKGNWSDVGLNATEPAFPTYYPPTTIYLYPSRMPWLNYSPSRNDLPGNGWMPRDQAGGGTALPSTYGRIKPGSDKLMILNADSDFASATYYKEDLNNSDWSYVIAKSLTDALDWIKDNYGEPGIGYDDFNVVYISTHGSNRDGIIAGSSDNSENKWAINAEMLKSTDLVSTDWNKKQASALKEIADYFNYGAHIVFSSCTIGLNRNLTNSLFENLGGVNRGLNMYFNNNFSSTWVAKPPGIYYNIKFNRPITSDDFISWGLGWENASFKNNKIQYKQLEQIILTRTGFIFK
jgi:RHS repeat-associated protein